MCSAKSVDINSHMLDIVKKNKVLLREWMNIMNY